MVNYSDFWANEIVDNIPQNSTYSGIDVRLIRMAHAKRAIGNFVKILTDRNIPVIFKETGTSKTDGKTVYISAKITLNSDFDVAVGLALHEGAHILLSDFTILETLWQRTPRELYDAATLKGMTKDGVRELLKIVLNYVEDRYIDQYIYTTAPGYQGYYLALYDKYFNTLIGEETLRSDTFRTPTVDAYLYRIINFTNRGTDLTALPDLDTIFKLVDHNTILRLVTPVDRLHVAVDICRLIIKNLEPLKDTPSSTSNDEESDTATQNTKTGKQNPEEQKSIGTVDDFDEMSVEEIEKLKNEFVEQKKFVNGNVDKIAVSNKDVTLLDIIEQSEMSLVRVGKEFSISAVGIDCIVVKHMTLGLILQKDFPLHYASYNNSPDPTVLGAIHKGVAMGKILGKRLQLRNDVNVTKFVRKSTGRIDRRILAELSFDNENVFYNNIVEQYNASHLHISVDASSSMAGDKWLATMTTVVAVCKAASLINNIRVSVSFRTTSKATISVPYVLIAYDSLVDKFNKILNLFGHLTPNGFTPEGLVFEAIMLNLPTKKSPNEDNYFLNLSDGQPYFSTHVKGETINYNGTTAANHTRTQVNLIRNMGYKVLAYFIANIAQMEETAIADFRLMYGKDASFIDVENITQIAKTLNELFLRKNND